MDKTNSRSSHPRATPCRYIAALSSQRTVLISRSLLQLTKCGGACIHTFHSFCSRNQLIAAFVFCCYLHLEMWFLLSRYINVISYFLVPPPDSSLSIVARSRSHRGTVSLPRPPSGGHSGTNSEVQIFFPKNQFYNASQFQSQLEFSTSQFPPVDPTAIRVSDRSSGFRRYSEKYSF